MIPERTTGGARAIPAGLALIASIVGCACALPRDAPASTAPPARAPIAAAPIPAPIAITAAPPPTSSPPLTAEAAVIDLPVEGHRPAVVSIPLGGPRPSTKIIIA